jgi:hypothetical protein
MPSSTVEYAKADEICPPVQRNAEEKYLSRQNFLSPVGRDARTKRNKNS